MQKLYLYALYANAFIIGFAIMGFEMIASRFMVPFFGGNIETWAALISMVLLALMCGYNYGGSLADRKPSAGVIANAVLAAAVYIGLIPVIADPMFQIISSSIGEGPFGLLAAACVLTFIPVALLGMFTPFVIKLALSSVENAGRVSGRIYGVSTLGNIVGTLGTTFVLIPMMGSRAIAISFAVVLVISALLLFTVRNRNAVAAIFAVFLLTTGAARAEPMMINNAASYPEGALLQNGTLYYAEMGKDQVSIWDGKENRQFFYLKGCGPTSISPYNGGFMVTCHLGNRIATTDASGNLIKTYKRTGFFGDRLIDPNDSMADGRGGVYFSSSGLFSLNAPSQGSVFHLQPDGKIVKVAGNIHYANGILVAGGYLYASEHLSRRILKYKIAEDGSLGQPEVFFDFNAAGLPHKYELAGPDGLEADRFGNVYVPEYGEGKIHIVSPEGSLLHTIELTEPYVTSVALTPDQKQMFVTAPIIHDRPPFTGDVLKLDNPVKPPPTQDIVINTAGGRNYIFHVEIAQDEIAAQRGLMYRTAMEPDHGMLFVMQETRIASFWMKHTLIPLDMLFVMQDGTIRSIHQNARPEDETTILSEGKVSRVLELNAGTVEMLGIKVGDKLLNAQYFN